MKLNKRFTAFLLAAVLAFSPAAPAMRQAQAADFFSLVPKAAKNGWVTSGTRTYYYVNNKKVKGLKKISGKYYIFNSNSGALVKNKVIYKYNASKYYKIDKKGVATRFVGTSFKAAKLLYDKLRDTTAFNMLKKGFQWVSDSTFNSNVPEPPASANKATYYGTWGLTKHSGDCAVMAYTFYWMAKVLGYNVKVINGYYKSGSGDNVVYKEHSWCEVKHGSVVYVYDPDFNLEFKSRISRSTYGFNSIGFKVRYGASQTLKYCREDKTEIEKNGKA